MKLEKTELLQIESFIEVYRTLHNEITGMNNEIVDLNLRKSKLISKLELMRDNEVLFGKALEEKYGKGNFNTQTLEYEID